MNNEKYFNELCRLISSNTYTDKILNLSGLGLNAKQAEQLAVALNTNNYIQNLDISKNLIGDVGAKALAQNTSLLSLNLSNNQIGVAGAQALAQNTSLQSLNVGDNQIKDAGAKL